MSTKVKCFLIILAGLLLIGGAILLCWLHVDGKELALPEGEITGYVTRLDIGLDAASGTATHDTESFDITQEQIDELLQLLRASSYWRTRHGNSVSFDGDLVYTVSLSYREDGKTQLLMISFLDNELINVDTSLGYLRLTDPEFLEKVRSILEN